MSDLPGMDDYHLKRNNREYYDKRKEREDDITGFVAGQVKNLAGDNLGEWYRLNKNIIREMIVKGIPEGSKPENLGEVRMIEIKLNDVLFPPTNYLDLLMQDEEDSEEQ